MSLNFDKTNLTDGTLVIINNDNSTTFILEEGCSKEEKFLFDEFRAKYPNGKIIEIFLYDLKAQTIQRMSDECQKKIIYEFYSDCLGNKDEKAILIKDHFDCEDRDQSYIQGLANKAALIVNGVQTDGILEWKRTGEPVCYAFTPQQCIKLGLDMFDHITEKKKRFEAIRVYILELTESDRDLIQNFTWDTTVPEKYFSIGSDTSTK